MAASSQRSINRLSDFHSSHAAPTVPLRSQAPTTVLVAKLQPGNRENPRFYLPTHVSSHDRGRRDKQQITKTGIGPASYQCRIQWRDANHGQVGHHFTIPA